jgi:hypothetical protein
MWVIIQYSIVQIYCSSVYCTVISTVHILKQVGKWRRYCRFLFNLCSVPKFQKCPQQSSGLGTIPPIHIHTLLPAQYMQMYNFTYPLVFALYYTVQLFLSVLHPYSDDKIYLNPFSLIRGLSCPSSVQASLT